ncbi:FKBP-type peptidyl-prolyl cis-trans isomerase [Treponema sp.]|uniref:FKBP-type peptidyl-prolyl cis-trans isomerase n=1 Tax=Treponema sp. TaxID=166 RepID=UPI003F056D6F
MTVENNKYVSIYYTLKNDKGEILDSSMEETLDYVHGRGYLISGLEKCLEGKNPGDKFSAVIEPSEGYGEYRKELVAEVDRSNFEDGAPVEIGMAFQAMTAAGPRIVRVTAINGDKVTVDANHELAGEKLHFDVQVVAVRNATEEELNPPSCGCGGNCGGCGGDCSDEGCGCGCGGECSCEN